MQVESFIFNNTIPEGKFRVVQASLKEAVPLGDYDSPEEAFKIAQKQNSARH